MAFLAVVLSVPFLALFNGWVISVAWNWFVPDITGWTRLGILPAIGIAIVVQLILPSRYRSKEEQDQDGAEMVVQIGTHVAAMLLTLALGWVVHAVMA